MTHYICTGGCKGVSDKPGVCQAVDCPKLGKPLTQCDCADNLHGVTTTEQVEAKRNNS